FPLYTEELRSTLPNPFAFGEPRPTVDAAPAERRGLPRSPLMAVSLEAGDRLGPYELGRYIREGAFGQVWVGRHDLVRDYCAVKVVPECELGRVEMDGIQRYRGLADNHTGLVPVRDVALDSGRRCYYYTMPLADDVRGKAVVR